MQAGKPALATEYNSVSSRAAKKAVTVSLIRFLLQRNAITGQLALDALDHFQRTRIFLGRLAIREQMLGLGACIHVLDQQTEEVRFGHRRLFGEIAVGLGYLSEAQVESLLDHQRSEGPSLASILLDLEGSDVEHMRDELAAYGHSQDPIRRT